MYNLVISSLIPSCETQWCSSAWIVDATFNVQNRVGLAYITNDTVTTWG